MGSFFALCIPSDLFFYFSLILYRYYEDFKIDLRTGEANLTQIYLQVLFILVLLSNTQWLYGSSLFWRDLDDRGWFCYIHFIVVYRKLSISLASSRPASSRSFYTGQSMLLMLLFMLPNISWALVREDGESYFCVFFFFIFIFIFN